MRKSDWLQTTFAVTVAVSIVLAVASGLMSSGIDMLRERFDFDSPAVTDPQLPTMSANPPQSEWLTLTPNNKFNPDRWFYGFDAEMRSLSIVSEESVGFDFGGGPCGYSACEHETVVVHSAKERTDEWVAIEWDRDDPDSVPNVTWGAGIKEVTIKGEPWSSSSSKPPDVCTPIGDVGQFYDPKNQWPREYVDSSFSFENHPCKPEDYEPGGPCNLRGESPEESAIRAKCRLRATATVPTPKEWEALDCSRFESGESAGQNPDVH